MGGEHFDLDDVKANGTGSPPHGRGTQHLAQDRQEALGLTPAWAGNTSCTAPSAVAYGLTPAWAGNTSPAASSRPGMWAHPRMGGEHAVTHVQPPGGQGSPPHGRGTHLSFHPGGHTFRLTPAWAGNTSAVPAAGRPRGAHPRMGGEHQTAGSFTADGMGSPPHGRGTPDRLRRRPQTPGLTPAWAGNTRLRSRRCPWPRAHPRMGGEHGPGGRRAAVRHGLTPAWAGNTAAAW